MNPVSPVTGRLKCRFYLFATNYQFPGPNTPSTSQIKCGFLFHSAQIFSMDQFFHLSFALNWHLIYVACLSLAPSTLFGEQYLLFTWISCNAYYAYMHVFLNQSLPFKTVQCFSGVLSIPISNVRKVPPGGRERESEVRFILLCFQTATNLRRAEIEMKRNLPNNMKPLFWILNMI